MGATIAGDPSQIAVIDGDTGQDVGYEELEQRVSIRSHHFEERSLGLAFLCPSNDIRTVVDYLALRSCGVPFLLVDGSTAIGRFVDLVDAYRPGVILGNAVDVPGYERVGTAGHEQFREESPETEVPHDQDVSVLLPTSGSTGNPKFVQLSNENLNVNAEDIVTSLGIDEGDRGLQPLPLFYSYGLSILNSHLAAGATTVLTSSSPIRPEFWDIVESQRISSIPGVPYSYAMFRRAGIFDRRLPDLRYLSQAGGKLPTVDVVEFHRELRQMGTDLFVMYGQTEASPRMSVLPPTDLPDHAHTAGFALEHGSFAIVDQDAEGIGEVVFDGPNVMVGYASDREQVGVRSQSGPLVTGDLGRLDDEGRLIITGRRKRIAKIYGNRINLQDVESEFALVGPVAAVEGENQIYVFHEGTDERLSDEVKRMEQSLRVPPRTIVSVEVDELPRNANGKLDYRKLAR